MRNRIESLGSISLAQSSEVQGLINFATSFFVSRSFRHLISALAQLADHRPEYSSKQVVSLCRYAIAWLPRARPREHFLSNVSSCIHIFTDGAWENETVSGGVVLVDPSSDLRVAAVVDIPTKLVTLWRAYGIDQIISQIELFVLVAVRYAYRCHLKERKVVAWIDNEAARYAAIKANSPLRSMQAMTRFMHEIEAFWPSLLWFERVSSFSNPADGRHEGSLIPPVTN